MRRTIRNKRMRQGITTKTRSNQRWKMENRITHNKTNMPIPIAKRSYAEDCTNGADNTKRHLARSRKRIFRFNSRTEVRIVVDSICIVGVVAFANVVLAFVIVLVVDVVVVVLVFVVVVVVLVVGDGVDVVVVVVAVALVLVAIIVVDRVVLGVFVVVIVVVKVGAIEMILEFGRVVCNVVIGVVVILSVPPLFARSSSHCYKFLPIISRCKPQFPALFRCNWHVQAS